MVNTCNGQHSGSEPHANGAPPPPELATLVVQQAELIRLLTEERQGRGQLQPREPRNRDHGIEEQTPEQPLIEEPEDQEPDPQPEEYP
ncbi:hypothetical protein U9M48_022602 [Paspalum notatum var. saurae]|uniref:Uncharacterized protein n=1 Tax=Paspalum notatum var. saurae TaxID=547442 RepID=A0AAQ3TIK9_PASNO